jgi:hypothetical protein
LATRRNNINGIPPMTSTKATMTTMGDPPQAFPRFANRPPVLRYTRYYYPLVLFLFFIVALGAWGIATSESSKPTPPPVTGIYTNGRAKKRARKQPSEHSTFKRIAARFPGGSQQNKEADERRLGPIRKAAMNWLLAGVLLTLVGNAVNVIMHALTNHDWWCGKAYVVR